MCRAPILKIITNKDHLMDRGKSIDDVQKPKRVSFYIEAKQPQVQVQQQQVKTQVVQNNDLIVSQLKNNLETALLRIVSLEKDLKESTSRETALMVFYEKYNNKHKPLPLYYYYYNLDVTQTIV